MASDETWARAEALAQRMLHDDPGSWCASIIEFVDSLVPPLPEDSPPEPWQYGADECPLCVDYWNPGMTHAQVAMARAEALGFVGQVHARRSGSGTP